MDVVILAGGKLPADFAAAIGSESRWDVPIPQSDGTQKPIGDVVLDAVRPLGPVTCIGGPARPGVTIHPGGRSMLDSLRAALETNPSDPFLVTTCDIPDLTADDIQNWLNACPTDADLCYPIIPMALCERDYPGMKRTTLAVQGGPYTGGNLMRLRPDALRAALPVMERAYAARKSPLKLGAIVGLRTLGLVIGTKLLPGRVSVPSLEREVGRFLGISIRGVVCQSSAIGTDLDALDQYHAYQDIKRPKISPS